MTQLGPSATPGPRPRVRRLSRDRVIWVLVALLVILALVTGYLLWQASTANASETALEPTNVATADSFKSMPSGGTDVPTAPPPNLSGGAVSGSTPGLFGGTQDFATCDQGQLVQFLRSDQDKAAAWAGVEGIDVNDIPSYVPQLTAVLLRADTYVTDHGYRNGELTSYPAVLQAGTAVLIDGFGTPRVKCSSGNPLSSPPADDQQSAPPEDQPAQFVGTPWVGFEPVTVVVVQPAPVLVTNLTVINIQNNIFFTLVLPPWPHGGRPDGFRRTRTASHTKAC